MTHDHGTAAGAAASGAGAPAGRTRLAGLACALGLLALYVATRSQVHTWDSIAYAARAAGDPLLSDQYLSTRLFHPHHLFYGPFALAAYRALAPLGLANDPMLALQIVNALLGALSAWLAGRLAVRLGAGEDRALPVTVAVGLSNAVWRFSTEVLVMVPSLAFLLLSAWLAARARTRLRWVGAGSALAGAMLIHQSAAVFALGASAALLVTELRGRLTRGAAVAFTLGWLVPAAMAYLAVGRAETGSFSPAELAQWMTTAGSRSTSIHRPPGEVLWQIATALAESWVSLNPLRAWSAASFADPGRWLGGLAVLLGLVGGAGAAIAALPGLARALGHGPPAVPMLVSGGIANAVLIGAFQPWNHAYWVFVPGLGGALIAFGLARPAGRAFGAAPLVIVAVVVANLMRVVPATDPAHARYADLVDFGRAHLRPGDRLVCGGTDSPIAEGIIALPYFVRVPVIIAPAPGHADQAERFSRLVGEAFDRGGPSARVFATSDALAPLVAARPGLAARPIGTLRGLTVYRVEGARPPSPPGP